MLKKLFLIFMVLFFISTIYSVNYTDCNSTVPSGVHYVENDITTVSGCFDFSDNNIIFDCQGFSVTGGGNWKGFDIFGWDNITIKNCVIENFGTAIEIDSSNTDKVINVTVRDNNYGILIDRAASYNIIDNSIAENNNYGIYIDNFDGGNNVTNTVSENNILYNLYFDSWTASLGIPANISGNKLGNFSKVGSIDWINNPAVFNSNNYLEGTVPSPPCFDASDTICDNSYTTYTNPQPQAQSSSSSAFPMQDTFSLAAILIIIFGYIFLS